jgi:hypothetical protein
VIKIITKTLTNVVTPKVKAALKTVCSISKFDLSTTIKFDQNYNIVLTNVVASKSAAKLELNRLSVEAGLINIQVKLNQDNKV